MALPEPAAVARPASPFAEDRRPSLELLEFLGEFGDDEDGLFDAESPPAPEARRPPPVRTAPPRVESPPRRPVPKEQP